MDSEAERKAEFAEYLGRDEARLYTYLHYLVHDMHDADDLFQQVSLVLWQKFDEFDRERSFLRWACGIGRLTAMNFCRSRSKHQLYLSDEVNLILIDVQAGQSNEDLELRREALAHCLQKLRTQDRELVLQCYGETKGIHSAAETAGRSTQSVHNSLRRVRRALLECVRNSLALGTSPGSSP